MRILEPTIRAATPVAVVAGLLLAACGGSDEKRSAVREYDGEELTELLRSAGEAIGQDDEAGFKRLYAADAQGRAGTNWNVIQTTRWNWGDYLVSRMVETPSLERKETGIHVRRVDLHAWFDLTRDTGEAEDIYRTKWSLVREDSLWRLNYVEIEKNPSGYGAWMRGLRQMGYREFLAMDMDWEEGYDETPLLDRGCVALASRDPEKLKPLFVDGALFRALEANVEIPGTANGAKGPGEENRSIAHRNLEDQVKRMGEATEILGVEPPALAPYFAAYRVTAMPADCTKLSLIAQFDGAEVPAETVTRFSLKWTGVYLKSRWLLETMHADRIYFD
jgi:hypothetical protein